MGTEFLRAEGRTEGRADTMKLIVAFRNFANVPKNSTFCPHSLHMCFWMDLRTNSDYFLYTFNCPVFTRTTETVRVYCAVQSGTYISHHLSVIDLGHLLTRSGLTYPEVSSKACHDSFCQLENSASLPWVIYYEAFYLHVYLYIIPFNYCLEF